MKRVSIRSRPEGRDNRGVEGRIIGREGVSIRSRPEGRDNRPGRGNPRPGQGCFNPLPARRPG